MPSNLVRTAKDEAIWNRAKASARKAGLKEGTKAFYKYATAVFERIKKGRK